MPKRPCLKCGTLTAGSYCRRHQPRGYKEAEYRRNRQVVISRWVMQHGWLCPGIEGQPAHGVKVNQLTADHIVPLSRGGSHDVANLRALCQRCNSMRGSDPV